MVCKQIPSSFHYSSLTLFVRGSCRIQIEFHCVCDHVLLEGLLCVFFLCQSLQSKAVREAIRSKEQWIRFAHKVLNLLNPSECISKSFYNHFLFLFVFFPSLVPFSCNIKHFLKKINYNKTHKKKKHSKTLKNWGSQLLVTLFFGRSLRSSWLPS